MKQDSWLYSDSFLKRAFAIWGYYVVANLIIGVPCAIIAFLIAITIGANIQTAP